MDNRRAHPPRRRPAVHDSIYSVAKTAPNHLRTRAGRVPCEVCTCSSEKSSAPLDQLQRYLVSWASHRYRLATKGERVRELNFRFEYQRKRPGPKLRGQCLCLAVHYCDPICHCRGGDQDWKRLLSLAFDSHRPFEGSRVMRITSEAIDSVCGISNDTAFLHHSSGIFDVSGACREDLQGSSHLSIESEMCDST